MRKVYATAAAVLAASICGCAKNSNQIAAAYVSPYQYENFTCPQISEEAQRVSARAAQVAGVQDEKATKDAVATTVGVIVFWPALFLIGANDQQTAELSRLRGELEALEQVSVRKRCGGRIMLMSRADEQAWMWSIFIEHRRPGRPYGGHAVDRESAMKEFAEAWRGLG